MVRVAFSILYRFNVNFPEKNIQKYADSLFVIYFIYIILVKTVIYNICELVKIIIIKNNKIIIIYYIKIIYYYYYYYHHQYTHDGKRKKQKYKWKKKNTFPPFTLTPLSLCMSMCATMTLGGSSSVHRGVLRIGYSPVRPCETREHLPGTGNVNNLIVFWKLCYRIASIALYNTTMHGAFGGSSPPIVFEIQRLLGWLGGGSSFPFGFTKSDRVV